MDVHSVSFTLLLCLYLISGTDFQKSFPSSTGAEMFLKCFLRSLAITASVK